MSKKPFEERDLGRLDLTPRAHRLSWGGEAARPSLNNMGSDTVTGDFHAACQRESAPRGTPLVWVGWGIIGGL